ncbi:MAG: response regulator [Bdellovibrionales bacterium]
MAFIKRNVLFVDDDPMARTLISTMLTQAGYIVTCVDEGFEALELLERHPFDLLILDIMMNKMNGIDLLKRIKAQPKCKDVPVVMLSARDDKQMITRAIQAGAADYVVKPPQRESFLKKIENILGGRPRFAEVHMDKESAKGACDFIFPARILSIGEAGMTFFSPMPLEINATQQIQADIFTKLGIKACEFKVLHCQPEKGGYIIYVNYLGHSAEEVQAVRDWVISQALKGRTVA